MKLRLTTVFAALLFIVYSNYGYAQSCASVNAGNDDTICIGQTGLLTASYAGPAGTNTYATSFIPYAPYSYTGGQVVLANLDDAWSPAITLPFCFDFYGGTYSQILIGTNGLITFDVSQASGLCPWTINVAAPNPGLPLNAIMAPYHDIDPMLPVPNNTTVINYQTFGTAPCRKFVVSWNDIAMYGTGCSSLLSTSQVVLHETTYAIDIFIANKSVCTSWNGGAAIEGIQNASGSAATVVLGRNYPAQWSATNDGVRFIPTGPPAVTYQWLNPANVVIGTNSLCAVAPTQTTTYTLSATYISCNGVPVTFTDQVTLHVIQQCLTASLGGGGLLCTGACTGTLSVTATNGTPPYSYSWNPVMPPTQTQNNMCAGTYTCTVTDATGQTATSVFTLFAPPGITTVPSFTPTLCNTSSGTASVSAMAPTGPFTYLWNTGDTTSSITNLPAGTYTVIVTDTLGCADTVPITIPPIGLNLSVQTTPLLCNGDSNAVATVSAGSGAPPYTYTWSPNVSSTSTASALGAGFYLCTVVDAANCTTAITFTLTQPAPIIVTPASNQTICDGETAVIAAVAIGGTAPYSYVWNNNLPPGPSHTITPTQTTIYTVDVTDANGCVSPQQSTQVKVHPDPVVNFYSIEAQCPPALVPFTNLTDTAVSYVWDFGDPASGTNNTSTAEHPTHLYAQSGSYNVTLIATNSWGCADTLTLPSVVVPASPTALLAITSQFLVTTDPTCVFYNNSTGGDYFFIDFGDGDTMTTQSAGPYDHAYDSAGTYSVMLVAWNDLGCYDTSWVELTIEEPTTCWIPNAFTPNGIGENNTFMVYGINFKDFELMIFDRWGLLIFSSTDPYHGWDGTYKGSKCQEDVYVWKLRYIDNSGNEQQRIGHVSLIR